MSEHQQQVYFFNWVRRNRKLSSNIWIRRAMELCYAVPNGISSREGQKAKLEGLTRGMPDINLDWPTVLCEPEGTIFIPGLRIEMKFGKNTLSKAQKEKKELLEKANFKYCVCYSAEEAVKAVMTYLPFPEKDYIGPKYL